MIACKATHFIHIPSTLNCSDVNTKPLVGTLHHRLIHPILNGNGVPTKFTMDNPTWCNPPHRFYLFIWHPVLVLPAGILRQTGYFLHASCYMIIYYIYLFGWLSFDSDLVQPSPGFIAWKGSDGNWLLGINVFLRLSTYIAEHSGEYCCALWRILLSIFGSRHSEGLSAFSQFTVSILRFISNIRIVKTEYST
jgi:hypothetical protein